MKWLWDEFKACSPAPQKNKDSDLWDFLFFLLKVYLEAANVLDSRYHFLSLATFKYETAKYALIISIFNWQYPLSQDYHPLSVLVDSVPNPTLDVMVTD